MSIDIALVRDGGVLAWGGRLGFNGHYKESGGSVVSPSAGVGQGKAISELLSQLKYPVNVLVSVYGEDVACEVVSGLMADFGQHQLEIVGRAAAAEESLLAVANKESEAGKAIAVHRQPLVAACKLLDSLGVDDPFICFENVGGGKCFVEHVCRPKSADSPQIKDEIQCDLFE